MYNESVKNIIFCGNMAGDAKMNNKKIVCD